MVLPFLYKIFRDLASSVVIRWSPAEHTAVSICIFYPWLLGLARSVNYRINWRVGASGRCSNCISCHHVELNIRPGQKSVHPVSEQVSPCVANCPTLCVFCLLLHCEPCDWTSLYALRRGPCQCNR